jgi:hypothetical protein
MHNTPHGYENMYVASDDGSFFDAGSGYVEVWSNHGENYADCVGEMHHDERVVKRSISVSKLVEFWEKFNGPLPMNDKYDPDFDPSRDL